MVHCHETFRRAAPGRRNCAGVSRAALYALSLIITLASVAIYADVALGAPRVRVARFFLAVPVAELVAVGVVLVVAAAAARRDTGSEPR